jgi:hypothetical protein
MVFTTTKYVATVANGVCHSDSGGNNDDQSDDWGMQLSAECAVIVNELVITERSVTQDTCIKEGAAYTVMVPLKS